MIKKNILFFLSCLILFNTGCDDDDIPVTPPLTKNGFYIINEGGFNHGNGTLGYYNIDKTEYIDKLYKNANQHVLGDIFQSFYFHGNKGYCVLNNSGYIEIIDTSTYTQIDQITGLNSPRNMLFISQEKAYISDLYSNSIQVWDLPSHSLSKRISIPSWTEEMIQVGNQVFVTAPWDTRERIKNQIYIIDIQTDALIDSIEVGYDPTAIELDKAGKLWVFCRGAEDELSFGGLYRINAQTHAIERTLPFDDYDTGFNNELVINKTKDTLYYLKNDIFRLPIDASDLPQNPIVYSNEKTFYSLGINPYNGDILSSDAGNFVQKGSVFIYKNEGTLRSSFTAGVIPAGFVFK